MFRDELFQGRQLFPKRGDLLGIMVPRTSVQKNVSVSSLHLVLAGLSLMRLGGNLCKKLFLTLKCVIQMA